MPKPVTASIIIPAFNHAALTRQCLEAILGRDKAEVIVVDDGSTDGTARMLAVFGNKIKVVKHRRNSGFATSCNDGASTATGQLLVFLNNDTIPQPGWLGALVRYSKRHPKAAAVGAKLLYPDNTIQHAGVVICQDGYPRHIYSGFRADHPAVCRSRRFQIVTAAAMLVRRDLFLQMGGFDTSFRNGFEDVDFCLRLGEVGHEVHFCAESVVEHLESVSPGRFRHDNRNVALYRRRWLGKVQPDDLSCFLEDGLLGVEYEGSFPVRLKVKPELAVVDSGRVSALEKELAERTRQVADQTREISRLRAELGGASPDSAALAYDRVRARLRELASRSLPTGARALVISKGDGALLDLGGREASHFPQSPTGGYAGFHPKDGKTAVEALRRLLSSADHLVIPQTSLWWLDYYREFGMYLQKHARLVAKEKDVGRIYRLNTSPGLRRSR